MSNPVFKSIYPYTQELLAEYPLMSDATLDATIENASEAYRTWRKYKFSERADIFKNVAVILRRDQETLATLITREMGKIFSESRAEVEKCAVTAEYYADHAESFLNDEFLTAGYTSSFVSYEPIGVVLGIMP